jgi:opacity protein-like surface antigen
MIKSSFTMKNRATILLFILLSTFGCVKAQTQFGIKAGVNYVNNVAVNAPDGINDDTKYRPGYHAGIFGRLEYSNKLSLRSELLFSNKGYKFDGEANAQPSGDGSMHLNYINLPLLVGYEIVDKLTFMLGPELGYLLSAKSKFESETIDVKNIWDNDFDFGLSAGANYSISEKFAVEIRYSHGLSSVIKDITITDESGLPTGETVKFLNRTFQLSAAYQLR